MKALTIYRSDEVVLEQAIACLGSLCSPGRSAPESSDTMAEGVCVCTTFASDLL